MTGDKKETKQEEKAEKKEMLKEQKEKIVPAFQPITIRDYSKVIFFYPLFLYSGVTWFIEHFFGAGIGTGWIAVIWFAIFFVNLFVIAFNFPTAKFFILFLALVVIALVMLLLYAMKIINFTEFDALLADLFTLDLPSKFYGIMTLGIGFVLLFVLIGARSRYVRIEENEVIIKTLLLGDVKRYPTGTIRYEKEITDVFEYLSLGAGRLTFTFGPEATVILNTVPRINKVSSKIDEILDVLQVSIARKP